MHTLTNEQVLSVSGGMGSTTKTIIAGTFVASPVVGAMLLLGYYANNQC
jgi:hypothetical protein